MYVCITIYNKILEDHGNIENVNHITQSHRMWGMFNLCEKNYYYHSPLHKRYKVEKNKLKK